MSHAYFGGKGGADKYRKMMGKEKYPGEHHVSRSKSEWKEFYKNSRTEARTKALEKKAGGCSVCGAKGHSGSYHDLKPARPKYH